MKKSSLILSLTGFGLSILSFAFLFLIPVFMGPNALYTLEGFGAKFGQLFVSLFSFSTIRFMQVVWIVFFAMLLSLWIAGIVIVAMRKRKIGAVELVLFFFEFHLFLLYCLLAFNPGWEEANGSFWTLGDKFTSLSSQFEQWGDFGLAGLVVAAKKSGLLGKGWTLFILATIFLSIVGFLLSFAGFIVDLCTSPYSSSPTEKATATKPKVASAAPSVIIVHDDEMNPEVKSLDSDSEADSSKGEEGSGEEKAPTSAAPAFYPGSSGVQGPILVQYINTFSPDSQTNSKKASSTSVPVSEIQGAIHEEKPLSVDDIRKIVREELAPKKEEKQPVIISIPSPASEEETASLTADDVRKILSDELKKSMGPDEGDVLVEEPKKEETKKETLSVSSPASEPQEEKTPEPGYVSKEDLRALIAEELAKAMPKEEPLSPVNPSPNLSAEDIRAIIRDELDKRKEEPTPSPISSDSLRDIIREELRDSTAPLPQTKVQPVTVVLSVPTTPATAEQTSNKEEAPASPSPAPVEQPAPKRRAVGETNPDLPPHDKIIRIPFQTRMKNAEKDMADNYNELKSEIMSYGVKSRISNKGDTFRLHKVTFVRIAVAGKGLKLYFALDPKDYANSPFPIQDVSHKKVYADIPLVFKVKSGLSMKRAKDLIADVMRKNGLSQGKIENKNWVNEIPDADEEDENEDSSED